MIVDVLQRNVAIKICKMMKIVQALCPKIPGEMSAKIAALGIGRPTKSCCDCGENSSRNDVEFSWLDDNVAAAAVSICASCGKPRHARFRPRILQQHIEFNLRN